MATNTSSSSRTVQASDVVVPFSEIATLLQSRLSGAELDDLLARLLSGRSQLIQPGDPITSDWAMDVMRRLALLEQGQGQGGTVSDINRRAAATFYDTRDAYASLVARGKFLPTGTSSDDLKAALLITTSLQQVVGLALSGAALAYAADQPGLLDLFNRLYSAQHDVAVLFASSLPGASDPGPRLLLAQLLSALLESNDSSGALSLHNAVVSGDLDAAIAAQNRINGLVTRETGQAVIGTVDVHYSGSTRGETLVPADALPFGFLYRVTNKTNQTLRLQLKAEFRAPRENWTSSIGIVGGAGRILTLQPDDPSHPGAPGTFEDVQLNVSTPPGAALNDQGQLRLTAFAPEPVGVAGLDSVDLRIGGAVVAPTPSAVRFDGAPVLVSGNLNAAPEGEVIEIRFDFSFRTSVLPPPSPDFRFSLEVANAADLAKFFVAFDGAADLDPAIVDAQRKVSRTFAIANGQRKNVTAQIVPLPGAAGTALNLTAVLAAVGDPTLRDQKPLLIKVV
jgi:hypothetical protein